MHVLLRRSSLWVFVNVAGMAAYLKLASALWVLPGEEGTPGGPGDAFYWLLYLAPLLIAFLILNSVALFLIVRRPQTSRRRIALNLWRIVAALWLGTVAFDHHKSFRTIDAKHGVEVLVERDA